MEEMYIKAIKGGILALKNGGQTTDEQSKSKVKVARALNALKVVNQGLYEDLLIDYKTTLAGLK